MLLFLPTRPVQRLHSIAVQSQENFFRWSCVRNRIFRLHSASSFLLRSHLFIVLILVLAFVVDVGGASIYASIVFANEFRSPKIDAVWV